ncbi:MAG TPA: hypothetical protein DDZ51_04905 [Planctomycetaceae bacterium]|nr:hypothetical protein [Planctomycetaceae bacterium]
MAVSFSKNLVGKTIVKFDCPKCKVRMRAPLTDAGRDDNCPECGLLLKIPGEEQLSAEQESQRKAEEVRKAAIAERELQRERKSVETKPDPTPPLALIESERLGDSLDPTEWLEGAANLSEEDFKESLPPAYPQRPQPTNQPAGSINPRNPRKSKQWWHDTIRIEPIHTARYPALIAYRNILVMCWWLMSALVFISAVTVPIGLIYTAVQKSRFLNEPIDEQLAKLQSPIIQTALDSAIKNQGMPLGVARQIVLFTRLEFPEFPNPLQLIDLSEPTTPADTSNFASKWQEWSQTEVAEANARRISSSTFVPSASVSSLLFLLGMAFFYVFISIMMLIGPECIKLAIDIEQAVRER